MDEAPGSGPVISVNSWNYVFQDIELPGMAGTKLDGTSSAGCVFSAARTTATLAFKRADAAAMEAVELNKPLLDRD